MSLVTSTISGWKNTLHFLKMFCLYFYICFFAMILGLALGSSSVRSKHPDTPTVHGVILGQYVAPPSPVHPHPAFATSGLRYKSPLDLDAKLLTTKHHLYQLDLNYDGTAEGGLYDPHEGAWIYVTTSRHTDRDHMVESFDSAFNEVLAREDVNALRRRVYFYFIDCATSFALCYQGIPFAAPRYQKKMNRLALPSLIYQDDGSPCTPSDTGCGDFCNWRCKAMYHYFDLPLRRLPWSRKIKVALNDGSGKHIVVPAFPSPSEQLRSLITGREALEASKVVGESEASEGIWRISVMPYELDKRTTWFKKLRLPL
jgi:hypothetical protein